MKQHSKGRPAPQKLRAVQTSRHWRVAPHRHTGHITHRRTTSYPALVMIVLCVGVFLAGWTRFVTADPFVYPGPVTNSYTVHASVPGPAPTIAPTIDAPVTGSKFTDQPVTVSGSCPLDTYVTLYRNGAFSGVALCQTDGTWQLETGLFIGNNQLQARVFSATDVPGPLSSIVTVSYALAAATPLPPAGGGPSSAGTPTSGSPATAGQMSAGSAASAPTLGEPLIFKTNFIYAGHYTAEPSTWQLSLEGGTAPYAIAVDWGDGTRGLISRPRAGSFNIDHVYKKPGAYKGSYVVKFSGTDTDGRQAFLQLITIVNNPPGGIGVAKPGTGSGGTPIYLTQLLKYVWPGYGILVLMLTSFWLGERREFDYLKPRLKKARHA